MFFLSINSVKTQAQVIPDGTLPTIVEQLDSMRKITGGERVGNNLFHSFEEFSIPSGMSAIFENATDIQNIFTRITGSEASFIDGLLQTAGGANFFLINPNGIVFGENAKLDIGGSFIATTGNNIEFADGTIFAAGGGNPNVSLSVTLPKGINFNGGNGIITVNGSGNQITNDSNFAPIEFGQKPTGLSVNDGNTLALIGNGVNFNGGVVTTEGGNIYLTSVESGSVEISLAENELILLVTSVNNYQDINLNQQSLIDASGEKVGNISLIGENININDASFILSQNEGNLVGGSIELKANGLITFSGTSPDGEISSRIRSDVLNIGQGKGANINISAERLILENIGTIQTATFSDSANSIGGDINIKTVDAVSLNDGVISASTFAVGNAGNINLSTSYLQITNAGSITSSTATSITSPSVATGNGGDIVINAEEIKLGESKVDARSTISSSSLSDGDTGNLLVNTNNLKVEGGAAFSASSFGNGNAGNITINAHDSITVSGTNNNFQGSSNPQTTIRAAVEAIDANAQRIFRLPEVQTGNSGNLTINTPALNISQEGVISVENQGTGSAGTLSINADRLNLDEAGKITAAASSGLGGNIELKTNNLNINNDSQITATASGNESGGNITITTTNLTAKKNARITASSLEGDGGNITINANSLSLNNQDSIAAASSLGNGGNITLNTDTFTLLDNSQVTANAIRGDGGNITINTAGYFVTNPDNISASSEFGLDGTVQINVSEEDLNQSFVLPDYPLVPLEEVLAKSCFTPRGRGQNAVRLNVLGKGGLPISPYSGIDEAEEVTSDYTKVYIYSDRSWQPGDPLLQVDQIVTTDDGQLLGVAEVRIKKCHQ